MTRYAMSKRRRAVMIALFVVAALVFIFFDHVLQTPSRRLHNKSEGPPQSTACDFEKYHKKTFKVARVVDGDTIDIDIADGEYETTRVRLWGVDTPETKSTKFGVMYFGPETADFTSNLVLEKPVCLYLEKDRTRGKYGRLLAYVQLPDGRFLNEVLLAEGFAYADLRFKHSFYNKYKQLEAVARGQKKGLWQNVKRHQLPEWLQRMKPTLLLEK
jgi:micrococcal nuclease